MHIKEEYITTGKAAELCHVTRYTIRNWVLSGKINTEFTAGGHRRLPKKDLMDFIEKKLDVTSLNKQPKVIKRKKNNREKLKFFKARNTLQQGLFVSGKYLALLKHSLLGNKGINS